MKHRNWILLFLISIILAFGFAPINASTLSIYSAEVRAPIKTAAADYTVNSFKEYCDALNKTAMQLNDTVKIRINNFDKKIYDTPGLLDNLENSYPGLFYIKDINYSWKQDIGKTVIMTIKLTYTYPKEKLLSMKKEIDAKLAEILSKITYTGMPLLDKELAIHDYVAKNVKFDKQGEKSGKYADESYNPYGALFKGTANSIGYARTMQMLLNRAGIECIIVYGETATWNIVKLDGEYYHVDACRDNIENKEGAIILIHDYFNISDEEMSKLNKWDRSLYPKCTSMKANFFHMNKTLAKNPEEYIAILRDGIDNVRDLVSVKISDYNEERYDVFKALYKISDDYPDLDYIDFGKTVYYSNDELGIVNVVMTYDHPKEELSAMKIAVDDKVKKIAESIIKPEMTEYEKEKAIHDYLVFNAKYNMEGAEKNDVPFEEHDAYGVLIKGIGVCDSYAEAFKMLLNQVGIECIIVSGDQKDDKEDDVGHAWNIVKIDGKYYQVDVTWDDREYDNGLNDLCYDYFNLTDEDMSKDHIWDDKSYPKCTSIDANYFNKHDRNVRRSQVEGILRTCLVNGESVIHIRVSDFDAGSFDIKGILTKLINGRFHKAKSVSWTTNSMQGVIKVTFDYH